MRVNLPVTITEKVFPEDAALVSRTDLKGRITYVNPTFVAISGFTPDELIGKAHNIIRHPDMPPEAFADMWSTLQSGQPWTAMVKNRCKNGDYYWVLANATPIRRGAVTEGYLSVRSKPSRAAVEEAEALYRRMREGRAGRVSFRRGEVVRPAWVAPMAALRRIPIRHRMFGTAAVASVLTIFLGGVAASAGPEGAAGMLPYGVAAATVAAVSAWLGLSMFLDRTLFRPLERACDVARAIAATDLQRFESRPQDEIRELVMALNQMSANFVAVVAEVGENVKGVMTASTEMASGNMDLSSRTEEQASALQQTAASMEELTATVRQNAENAQRANELSASASQAASEGGAAVGRVVETMRSIDDSSRRIADIIGVIDGIAFQTNILALNAAVEAARAGEQGRGFAVVAAEVRSLAQRSAGAAKEIKGLIGESVERVGEGTRQVAATGDTMQRIVESIARVATLMGEIATASREQSTGIDQVTHAVSQMDQVTQQNAALVEQAAASAASLEIQAEGLVQAVSVFRP